MTSSSTPCCAAALAFALAMTSSAQNDESVAPQPQFDQQTIDNIEIGYGLAIGDVDDDGDPDILLADKRQFVWYRNPEWTKFVMVENLTKHDNVCIAARDINGDGQVEVAVGGQWNPGETTDSAQSGSVHYLIRPDDPTQPWEPVQLHHEPTVHRMRWVQNGDRYRLLVLPLHGRGNVNGEGEGVRPLWYVVPENPTDDWATVLAVDTSLHLTHNLDVVRLGDGMESVIIASREGLANVFLTEDEFSTGIQPPGMEYGAGEVRGGNARYGHQQDATPGQRVFHATIEPMHGNDVVVYYTEREVFPKRHVLDQSLVQGHALACADLLGMNRDQIVAGWRNPNSENQVGIRLYVPRGDSWTEWATHDLDVTEWGDPEGMACEDLKVADLDGDGRLDIIAAGRTTKNVKIYWNRTCDS